MQEVGTAYDDATCARLKAEGELLILALRERELNGTRPLFSSPSLAQIREHLRRPQARPEPGQGTNPGDIEGLVASGESIAAGDLVWGELYSQSVGIRF